MLRNFTLAAGRRCFEAVPTACSLKCGGVLPEKRSHFVLQPSRERSPMQPWLNPDVRARDRSASLAATPKIDHSGPESLLEKVRRISPEHLLVQRLRKPGGA
jgi:hypothetical protein